MNSFLSRVVGLFAVGGFALAAEKSTTGWPQFRGANGAGVAVDAHPPEKIGPRENVRWSVEVPFSPSSPCVWGERIFLTTFHDGELQTRCYGRGDGRLLWSRGIKPDGVEVFHRSDGSPAASTPATDGRRLVSYFGSFGLICHDLEGRELWRHPLSLALSGGQYGTGTSPVIFGNRVVLNRDQAEFSSLLAVDLETGEKVWDTPRPDAGGSFGTPVIWDNNGVNEVVVAATGRLKGYDLQTGAQRWFVNGMCWYVCTTPVIGDGLLYFAAWSNGTTESPVPTWEKFAAAYDKNGDGIVEFDEVPEAKRDYLRAFDVNRDGKYTKEDFAIMASATARAENVIVAVKPGGRGDITETHVGWKFRKGLPYVSSPLFYDGRIYLVKDGGILTSLDAKTGDPFYVQERLPANGNYYTSPVAADGRLYVASVPGKLTVLKPGGEKPEILHQADFGERILATPAIVGDSIYLRTETRLWAFEK